MQLKLCDRSNKYLLGASLVLLILLLVLNNINEILVLINIIRKVTICNGLYLIFHFNDSFNYAIFIAQNWFTKL